MAQAVEALNADSLRHKHSYLDFLEALVDGEINARENKALMKRIKAARFPVPKTLEEFDFDFQPKLDVKLIKALASCDFITKQENVIFVGQPGTGKSHLSVALGMKACEAGYHVRFTTIQDLAATLRASMADQTTEARIAELTEPDLLILDELGFTPLDRMLADAFYRIIASRYERASTIVTSNKSFESCVTGRLIFGVSGRVLLRPCETEGVRTASSQPLEGERPRWADAFAGRRS